jgi:hypothetical protein
MSALTLKSLNERTSQAQVVPTASATIEAEKQRVIAEMQALIFVAQSTPRNIVAINRKIMENCSRKSFAEKAMYALPRKSGTIAGPSIRLLEMLANSYHNVRFGIRELEVTEEYTKSEAYCWDLENNIYSSKSFTVRHVRYTKATGNNRIEDQTEINMIVANYGSRHLREVIRRVLPEDLLETAVRECAATLKRKDDPIPISERIKRMHQKFLKVNVSKEMLENRLGHSLETSNEDELDDLYLIFVTLKNGEGKVEDYFQTQAKAEDATLVGLPAANARPGNSFMSRLAPVEVSQSLSE